MGPEHRNGVQQLIMLGSSALGNYVEIDVIASKPLGEQAVTRRRVVCTAFNSND